MQLSLDVGSDIQASDYNVGERVSGETHGVVLTKPHVVEMILNLVRYDEGRELWRMRILEPSCGEGAFLIEIVRRLIRSASRAGVSSSELNDCILAVDIDSGYVSTARQRVQAVLEAEGIAKSAAHALALKWVREGDFLLAKDVGEFDFVVGNPPYVRIEQISSRLLSEYRRRYVSLFDRADLYVAFIERSLRLLSSQGVLSFICADRWIANRYGGPLRRIIASEFRVDSYVDLHTSSPFESDVIAYPSIFVIGRGKSADVAVAKMDCASAEECERLTARLLDACEDEQIERHSEWFDGDEPWVLTPIEHLRALRHLEKSFPLLSEQASVGIGVATGADRVYIVGEADSKAVEPDRLVPLVMRSDIVQGKVVWGGRFVVNVFGPDGGCVALEDYPMLANYLTTHSEAIRRRHVAKKNPRSWFRTIDRVYPELVKQPKLLIPDIAGSNEISYDDGQFHPHHNLYFVVSDTWDLEVLGGLMSSRVALFFVWSYAVKMRGSYLRFQAQYLRRIRLPRSTALSSELRAAIKKAFQARDFVALDALALDAYGIKELPAFDFVDTRR